MHSGALLECWQFVISGGQMSSKAKLMSLCLMPNQNPNEINTAEEISGSMDWQQEAWEGWHWGHWWGGDSCLLHPLESCFLPWFTDEAHMRGSCHVTGIWETGLGSQVALKPTFLTSPCSLYNMYLTTLERAPLGHSGPCDTLSTPRPGSLKTIFLSSSVLSPLPQTDMRK